MVVLAPLLGWLLDRLLFRQIAPCQHDRPRSSRRSAVLVALPELVTLVFGSATRFAPPTLFLNPDTVYLHLFAPRSTASSWPPWS